MPKKTFRSKRRYTRRRRRTTKRSSKYARRQQKAAMTWIRKKYVRTFVMDANASDDVAFYTVSLIGAKNNSLPQFCVTLADCAQDGNLNADMRLYQFFRIRGVGIKIIFPPPTTLNASPCQWAMAYSASDIIAPQLPAARLQTMSTYSTGACAPEQSISRFYNTANTYRRFGIQYCSTSEFSNGNFGIPANTYGGQLLVDQGSSVNARVYRNSTGTIDSLARFEVTYYVTYKGTKGANSITAP